MIISTNYTPIQFIIPDDNQCLSILDIWENIYHTNQDTYSYISHVSLAREYNLIYSIIKTDKLKEINYPYTEVPTSSAENIEFYKLDNAYDLVLKEENNIQEIVSFDGKQAWYQNGKLHRDNDLPSEIHADGSQLWYKNGERHRDNDLPAVILENGRKAWFKNGVRYFPSKTIW